ncbi:MAG: polysaccharide deacetylase family protein, partial [Verrucomicrobiales bacterium]|nr:polysaccharide deacetylase family protein [Verrucomicrobiales bacterium]
MSVLPRRLLIAWNVVAPLLALGVGLSGGGWILAVLILGSAHWPWLWATLYPGSRIWGPMVSRRSDSAIWITIDDGPHPDDTPVLLDMLDEVGARAVFFFIGARAAAHPELVREVQRRGHELGNHTQTHPAGSFWIMPSARIAWEISTCGQTLRDACPAASLRWFRAPAGLRNSFVHPVLEREGLQLMGWSARGFDGVAADPEAVAARILKAVQPGS